MKLNKCIVGATTICVVSIFLTLIIVANAKPSVAESESLKQTEQIEKETNQKKHYRRRSRSLYPKQ